MPLTCSANPYTNVILEHERKRNLVGIKSVISFHLFTVGGDIFAATYKYCAEVVIKSF